MARDNQKRSALLTQAAKSVLRPLGLMQNGRSRTWLSDQIWWSVVVEFQPSGYSRGAHLNVGCMWLWHVKTHISFDLGCRVEGFHSFESENQFEIVANRLANKAAEHVQRYRKQFPTIRHLSDYFTKNPPAAGWPSFDAAIAHALSGRTARAGELLYSAFSQDSREVDWVKKAKRDTTTLLDVLQHHDRFRTLIIDRVRETRESLKLPEMTLISMD